MLELNNMNISVSYATPGDTKYMEVKDVPYLIRNHRDEFEYDDGVWKHIDNPKIWCTYNTISKSFVNWMNDNCDIIKEEYK